MRVHVDERQHIRAGQQRRAPRPARTRSWRATASSCRTLPQVNDRRNDPSVDGARSRRTAPPWRRAAARPCHRCCPPRRPSPRPGTATSAAAFTPHRPPIRDVLADQLRRPQRSARAITGTRPARDTRFGSSNDACVFAGSCNNRTCEVSSPAGQWKLQQLPSSQLRGHLSRRHARIHPYLRGGLRLRARRLLTRCFDLGWDGDAVGGGVAVEVAEGGELAGGGLDDVADWRSRGRMSLV